MENVANGGLKARPDRRLVGKFGGDALYRHFQDFIQHRCIAPLRRGWSNAPQQILKEPGQLEVAGGVGLSPCPVRLRLFAREIRLSMRSSLLGEGG